MDYKRVILYFALALVAVLLWNNWQLEHPKNTSVVPVATQTNASLPPSSLAQSENNQATTTPPGSVITNVPKSAEPQLITVKTDTLLLKINPQGGNIVSTHLLKYPVSKKTPEETVQLFNEDPRQLYAAESGLMGIKGPDTQKGQANYQVENFNYVLQPGQNSMDVKLSWQNDEGVKVTKIFNFERGKYNINVKYLIDNQSAQAWSGQMYSQLRRKPEATSNSIFSLHTFTGASISTSQDNYKKLAYNKLAKENLNTSTLGGWLAIQERYFLSAWVPDQKQMNQIYSQYDPSQEIYTVGYVGAPVNVLPKAQQELKSVLYVGPEVADNLKPLAPHLDLTIDYGWLWPISVVIFWIMQHIYNWVGNWGWSIVLVTLLIKIVFYKLSETSYRSMAKMRQLSPRLQALKERYGDDRQKLSQATMELYKKEKINPLGGCLPILIQIPFFIALYYVLVESVELRQAPFIFWIQDLSSKDPYYVLPILMGITMLIQQKLNPAPQDPMQAKMMMLMPVIFTVLFLAFPSGLVLYWLVNNILSVLQQWYIMHRYEKSKQRVRKTA